MKVSVQTCETRGANPSALTPGYSGLEVSLSGCGGLQRSEFANDPFSRLLAA